jgi:plastocyanin
MRKSASYLPLLTAAFLLMAVLAATTLEITTSEPRRPATQIDLESFSFGPPALNLPASAGLSWTNHDDAVSSVSSVEVKIDNFSFGPSDLMVPAGTTVTWTNHDDIPHTVVSTEGAFKSKVLDTDEKFSFTFSKAGIYPYFCSIHPKMTGKVTVK